MFFNLNVLQSKTLLGRVWSFETTFLRFLSFSLFLLFNLSLAAQCTVQGDITDVDGTPLVGANVYFPALKMGGNTDAQGKYVIADVPAGKHVMEVSYVGYETSKQTIDPGEYYCHVNVQLKQLVVTTDVLVVSATRADSRTPMTYSTVGQEALQKSNLGQDVPFLLRWTPSTVVTSDAGAGIGYTGIWIRGVDPTRTNVTINGIPLNDSESQGVFWVNMPDFSSSVEDVQIQRGVGASTNGAGAFGATVNMNTNKVHREAYGRMDASIGSFGTYKGSLGFGTGLLNDHFTIDGRLSRITSDGYIDRASVDLESWYLSGAWMNDQTTLRLNAFSGHEVTYQAWNGVDASLVDDPVLRRSNTAGTEKTGDPYDNEVDDYEQTHFQLLFTHQFNSKWYLNLAGHYTIGQGFFEQYKAGETLADYGLADIVLGDETITETDLIRRRWLDNDFYGSTYSLHYDSGKLRATLGGGCHYYEGRHFGEVIWARFASGSEIRDTYYDNDARKSDFNIFTKFNYAFDDRWDGYLDLQYRVVGYEFLGVGSTGDLVDQDADLSFFNPKVGVVFQATDRSRAYASFAVAQREPNRNDYTGSTETNRPKAEKLYNAELGMEQNGEKASVQANVYYMYYKDQLVLNGQLNDVGAALRTNVDESYRMGLEVSAGFRPAAGLDVQLTSTISRNKVVQFSEFIDEYDADFNWIGQKELQRAETDLAFSPNFMASGILTYDFFHDKANQSLELSLLNKYIGQRFLDNSSDENNALDAYFFSDLRLSYAVKVKGVKKLRLNAQVLNLWDSLYESNGWSYRHSVGGEEVVLQGLYPQAGRHFMLGVGVDF